jgi:cobalt/nickel transport protein
MKLLRLALAAVVAAVLVPAVSAHYNMLLPEKASAAKGDTVQFLYQWGHPFEHELFDAPMPEGVTVIAPDGKATAYPGDFLQKITVPAGDKKVTAYRFSYKPDQRGDYVFWLKLPPIWMEEEKEFYHDTVKVILHVQAQKGWDVANNKDFDLLPLTRPYGLLPGTVFQVQSREPEPEREVRDLPGQDRVIDQIKELKKQRPLGPMLEIERYNATPPKELPADEFITRTVRADPNGVATTTLTEPGWWCLTAQRDGGKRQHDGKMYPVKQRTTFWVHVDEKATPAKK